MHKTEYDIKLFLFCADGLRTWLFPILFVRVFVDKSGLRLNIIWSSMNDLCLSG